MKIRSSIKTRLSGKKRGMKLFPSSKYADPTLGSKAYYKWISKTIEERPDGTLVASKGLTYRKSEQE
jgi:hypothetical protein|tara:strand:- start:126 stop:326 length:201 start_codon:yes stop_codon:yes gene_type:complete